MLEPKAKTRTDINVTTEKLCFDKNEFMKENFSVDEFLHTNRNVPNLELLRDNLGLYLKGLRASMIDLINEDYADFVSLSANLVGLDQSIASLQDPLEQFRDEIESIQTMIEENVNEIKSYLEHKRQLRELKRNLQSLKKVYETQSKLENLLAHQLCNKTNAVHLERAALELIQLKFNEKFCTTYLKETEKQNIERLEVSVLEKLRDLLNESLKSANSKSTDELERTLRIYITLDACKIAEDVFRQDVVAPYMSNSISEQCLQNSPQGLAGVYSKVLNFISLHMTDLLRLTLYTDKLSGFNFLVNSFWADVEMRLESHMSSIFAPGNCEVFFAKYMCTRNFLEKIEELLANETAITHFRQHKQTKSFRTRWNLPVYFQICFQEIAGEYESMLEPLLHEESITQQPTKTERLESTSKYQLKVFINAEQAVQRCWADGVYLSELFPKFFKLHLQIILRLSQWIMSAIRLTAGKKELPANLNKINFLIALHTDLQTLIPELTQTQQQQVLQHIPKEQKSALIDETIGKSFGDLSNTIAVHLQHIQQQLVDILIGECGLENIRQVNDLPRLYRKTNRDVPTKCSAYIDQMLRPLKVFVEQQSKKMDGAVVQTILAEVLKRVTADYFVAVSDVLTSVQKTEESLRRLRNLKSGAPSVNLAGTNNSTAMSDDDKIRLQLRVDVSTWTNELSKLDFMPTQIDKLLELNNMVEESIKPKDSNAS